MNFKVKGNNGEWVEATYSLKDDTLFVEPKEEEVFIPQDGDIVVFDKYNKSRQIMICKLFVDDRSIRSHVFYDTEDGTLQLDNPLCFYFTRQASEAEKMLLFDKLDEEGFEWDDKKKEVRKKQWAPEYKEIYYFPSYLGCEELFSSKGEKWLEYDIDIRRRNSGWCFKTEEECDLFCNKLNEAIKNTAP